MIIIQARTNSSRFPNKIFTKINGKKLIDYSIDAAKRSGIAFVVAIPFGDEALINYLEFRKVPFFEGSELDVLDRFFCAAACFRADIIIRLCADTLYTKEDILEQVELYQKRERFTYGNGIFILSFDELKNAWTNAKGIDREHVTTYLYRCIDTPSDVIKWQKEL